MLCTAFYVDFFKGVVRFMYVAIPWSVRLSVRVSYGARTRSDPYVTYGAPPLAVEVVKVVKKTSSSSKPGFSVCSVLSHVSFSIDLPRPERKQKKIDTT